jgi:tmRNA-binding protein
MKVFAQNRKARNSYNFEEFYEAGIVLSGPETKSIRTGSVSIVDAFAIIENEEAFIMEMNIEPYKYAYGPISIIYKDSLDNFQGVADIRVGTEKVFNSL